MEEIIYILIGVIWLAATIYKASQKNKKKAGPQHTASPSTEEESNITDTRSLIEELLEGQRLRIPEPEVREARIPEPMIREVEENKPARSFQNEYARFGFRGLETLSGEGVSSLGDIKFEDHMKEDEKTSSGPVKIDLRKAIIYSAILERPYT